MYLVSDIVDGNNLVEKTSHEQQHIYIHGRPAPCDFTSFFYKRTLIAKYLEIMVE